MNIKSVFSTLLIVLGLGLAFSYVGLVVHYSNTLPRDARPEVDRTYPLNNHGTVVYSTMREYWTLKAIQYLALVAGVAGGLLFMRRKRDQK